MRLFSKKDRSWDAAAEGELARRDGEMGRAIKAALKGKADDRDGGSSRRAGMERLRQQATQLCLQRLDAALRRISLSSAALPSTSVEVDAFGRLSFERSGDEELQIRFQIAPGKLVNRKSILDYDQRLWSSYTNPSSLEILLTAQEEGRTETAAGPQVEDDHLIWRIAAARLGPHWHTYTPRLDCFASPEHRAQLRYAVGQAASAESGAGTREEEASESDLGEAVYIFSAQEEGDGELVVGIEWDLTQMTTANPIDFPTFKSRLLGTLAQEGIDCQPLSEFPSSGRLYLCCDAGANDRIKAAIALFNDQLSAS